MITVFTVYGPWGRPDMAYYLFAEAIFENVPIKFFNNGKRLHLYRRYYKWCYKIIERNIADREHYKIYNIGNNKTESLQDFITTIEGSLNKKALKQMLPIQPGDVPMTFANIDDLSNDYNYAPKIDIKKGVRSFITWFKAYKKNIKFTRIIKLLMISKTLSMYIIAGRRGIVGSAVWIVVEKKAMRI